MRILWALNVYDRHRDLAFNVDCIKNKSFPGYGGSIDVLTLCNSAEKEKNKFQSLGEDFFEWFPNSGHIDGTVDAYNATLKYVDGYDYVVSQHAKSWLSSYYLLNHCVGKMEGEHTDATFLDPGELGPLWDKKYLGYFLDFFVMTKDAYSKFFPWSYDFNQPSSVWIETYAYRRFEELGLRASILSCERSSNHESSTRQFTDIERLKEENIFSQYDWKEKRECMAKTGSHIIELVDKHFPELKS